MRNPILVALDVPGAEKAVALATKLAPVVGGFKVGSELFTGSGPDVVRRITALGSTVFLDLKYHDIPNTVAKAVAAATRLGVQMLTIHAAGGRLMMEAAEKAAQTTAAECGSPAPIVLGVTVLTSMDGRALAETCGTADIGRQVERLAELAMRAGLRGLVCSPLEIAGLRQFLPAGIQLVTPGIRSGTEAVDDQRRTLSAREALEAGADWLVIGRPIYAANDPRAAAEMILSECAR